MSDAGLVLCWSGFQATAFLSLALLVHGRASRRGPAEGARIATLALTLCLVPTIIPWISLAARGPSPTDRERVASRKTEGGGFREEIPREARPGSVEATRSPGWNTADVMRAFSRLKGLVGWRPPTATVTDRVRRLCDVAAWAVLAGVVLGLARMGLGLWAIRRCRRRGLRVGDADALEMLNQFRRELGVQREVELVETWEVCAPATAGWQYPFVLLPADWRSWDQPTRCAVLAHELAHVARRDYLAGLMARLALSLHFYNPLVHWLVNRLQLQQEQAADIEGARLGGGRIAYLLALTRLALRQEERLPSWPVRAFLPPRGALIRRIDMLSDESVNTRQRTSRTGRWLTAIGLLVLTLCAAALRSPLRAEDRASVPAIARPAAEGAQAVADGLYVPEDADGLIVARPAAIFRRFGKPGMAELVTRTVGLEFAVVLLENMIGDWRTRLTRFDGPSLSLADVDRITAGFRFGVGHSATEPQRKLHSFLVFGVTVRMTAPFDWLKFLRGWGFAFDEVRVPQGTYYRLRNNPGRGPKLDLSFDPCFSIADDRTLVLDMNPSVDRLARSGKSGRPAFLRSTEWQQASKGLLAVAIDNEGGRFARRYDLGRPDDAQFLELFDGVDHWVLGLDDADAISLHAVAHCRAPERTTSLLEYYRALATAGKAELQKAPGGLEPHQEVGLRMVKGLMNFMHAEVGPSGLLIHSTGFGTLADFASFVEPDLRESDAQLTKELAAAKEKQGPATRKR